MDWFSELVGFRESGRAEVHDKITVHGEYLHSHANKRRIRHGRLEMPSLKQLRQQTRGYKAGRLTAREMIGEAGELHTRASSANATFQVASQFNLLEMASPEVGPEAGVTGYGGDATQGPACAVACGGGTIYRAYFAAVGDGVGQCAGRQVETCRELGEAVGNGGGEVWAMRNGYAMGKEGGVRRASAWVGAQDEAGRDAVREVVRVGVQYGAEVTRADSRHAVTQVLCSAFPVGPMYCAFDGRVWAGLARVLLEGIYECTLRAAVVNVMNGGSRVTFLTLVGGGVFGNDVEWIVDAMQRGFEVMRDSGLDVRIVSYGERSERIGRLCRAWAGEGSE